jgi:hypothetical protein
VASEAPDSFWIDEEPLRKAIVKGHFGDRKMPLEPLPLIVPLRDLLSGPAGGPTVAESYFFETDPDRVVPAFFRGLEKAKPGLASLIAEPLLAAADDFVIGKRREIAPSPGVFVSGLAGSIAVKAEESEAAAAALLAGLLIAIARLGPKRVRALYRQSVAPDSR